MVTQELLEYIRTEVAKGKKREEIHEALVRSGGWSTEDLSEAFRKVIPMQSVPDTVIPLQEKPKEKPINIARPVVSSFSTSPAKPSSIWPKVILVFAIVALLCVAFWWFYTPNLTDLWNSYFVTEKGNTTENPMPQTNTPIQNPTSVVKDCGVGITPKPNTPSTYENNSALSCLGASALSCENAKAILQDDLFPTIFEITKSSQSPESCSFTLSYPLDSNLADITGKRLAGQYVSCPLSIVKAINTTNPSSLKFFAPNKTDVSTYASQIYFYGTLGLFLENNLDENKIEALGCSGEYIKTMIAGFNYKKAQ